MVRRTRRLRFHQVEVMTRPALPSAILIAHLLAGVAFAGNATWRWHRQGGGSGQLHRGRPRDRRRIRGRDRRRRAPQLRLHRPALRPDLPGRSLRGVPRRRRGAPGACGARGTRRSREPPDLRGGEARALQYGTGPGRRPRRPPGPRPHAPRPRESGARPLRPGGARGGPGARGRRRRAGPSGHRRERVAGAPVRAHR